MDQTLTSTKRDIASRRGNGGVRRTMLAAVAIAIAVASLVVSPSPASASHMCQRNYQFVPNAIWPEDIEDWWGDTDTIELRYLDQRWSTPIRQWERKTPPASGVFARYPGETFTVELFEWDGGSARHLGTETVSFTGHTAEVGSGFFRAGDYSYRLSYELKDLGEAGCVQLSGLSVSPTPVVGGRAVTGTVTLSGPRSSGPFVVYLSDNSSATSLPASVTVPAGASSARFTISTNAVATDTTVTIWASADGVYHSAPLVVKAATLSGVVLNPATVIGGSGSTGTVKLTGPAPAGGLVASLSSSSPAASVPSSLPISAGASSAAFQITTTPVSVDTTANICATVKGLTTCAPLAVKAASLVHLSVDPTSLLGGGIANGSVGINGSAPAGGTVVALSSNSSAASVPATVTIPAGASSAGFQIRTTPVPADTPATISATAGATRTTVLTVRVPRPTSVSLSPTAVHGGETSTGTVTLEAPAPPGGLTVPLASTNPYAAQVPASVFVPGGAWSASFTVNTTDVGHDDISHISATVAGVTKSATLTVWTNFYEEPPECDPRVPRCSDQ